MRRFVLVVLLGASVVSAGCSRGLNEADVRAACERSWEGQKTTPDARPESEHAATVDRCVATDMERDG